MTNMDDILEEYDVADFDMGNPDGDGRAVGSSRRDGYSAEAVRFLFDDAHIERWSHPRHDMIKVEDEEHRALCERVVRHAIELGETVTRERGVGLGNRCISRRSTRENYRSHAAGENGIRLQRDTQP
ncbi:hypothetical protein HALLA_02460 (plasmid) [Halostagnicola larsenii XH-48]|uniref:Uncharacterized protein n=1 Tax=Halostagnicola larsenii XH-48 TaxID=797299 RepID=W0JVG8_9EURY|nr:hypothetical protein HALLA_02460 [Halostagnicola larsenii XH-48]